MDIFFRIFENYGWIGITAILVCMISFILLRKYGNKIMGKMDTGLEKVGKELTEHLSEQNKELTTLLSDHNKDLSLALSNQNNILIQTISQQQHTLINYFVEKDSLDKKKHNAMLTARMELSESVNMYLKLAIKDHHAQRAFVLEFHNSYQNLSGVPFAKYSCNYEWFDKNLSPISQKCQSLPFSTIAKIVQDILESETQQVIYTDMKLFDENNPTLFSLIGNTKIKTIVYSGMYDNNNILIGLLALEYYIDDYDKYLNLNKLRTQSSELTQTLNIRYQYSNGNEE